WPRSAFAAGTHQHREHRKKLPMNPPISVAAATATVSNLISRSPLRRAVPVVLFVPFVLFVALTNFSALAQTCPTNVPHSTGTWTVLPYQMPINPISANLLPNGKVLIVAGSENDARNNSEGAESYRAAVWDPNGTNESSISVQNLTYDVFCSGTAALFDGRSLIVGGTSDYSFTGENRASIFNPA